MLCEQVLRVVRTSADQPAPAEVPAALMDAGASQQGSSSLDPASLSAHLAVEELQVPKPRAAGCADVAKIIVHMHLPGDSNQPMDMLLARIT